MIDDRACLSLVAPALPPRRGNVIAVEIGTPVPRCLNKQPSEWRGRGASSLRWVGSGGSPLVFGPCTPNVCPFKKGS